jgi:hypothetical protein
MSPEPHPAVEPCFRCGQPAEEPAVGQGWVAGQAEGRMPLCIACLALVVNDPQAFWEGMPQGLG